MYHQTECPSVWIHSRTVSLLTENNSEIVWYFQFPWSEKCVWFMVDNEMFFMWNMLILPVQKSRGSNSPQG